MIENIKVTELDFSSIKANIINYFKDVRDENGDPVYTDYDFAGSALNTLIDVLAYNTHYNAMTAHLAVNESFIGSAQIRSNVVAAAKALGYTPRSATSPSLQTYFRFERKANAPPSDTIYIGPEAIFKAQTSDRGSILWSIPGGVTLTFDEESNEYRNLVIDDSGSRQERITLLKEGRRRVVRYAAVAGDTEHKYIIDDDDVDVSSLIVRVFSNATPGAAVTRYVRFGNITAVDADSPVYFIDENAYGKYQIYFGNGILGSKLQPGSVVEFEYVSTGGAYANGIGSSVVLTTPNRDVNIYTDAQRIVVLAPASAGADRDTTERIRLNATSGFITQNRAVTADDYKSIIFTNFPIATSVSVWGGDENDPPVYGKVFVSVNKNQGDAVSEEVFLDDVERATLSAVLSNKKVLSIIPEIVDPEYINLVLDVLFKYDNSLTTLSTTQLQSKVRDNVVRAYNEEQLNSFDKVFRYSNFMRAVDGADVSILNSHVRVFTSKRFVFDPQSRGGVTLRYGTPCTVDDGYAIAGYSTSKPWTLNGLSVVLADRPDRSGDPNIRELYIFNRPTGEDENVIASNIGSINLKEGTLRIEQNLLSDDLFTIDIDLIPVSNDIVSRRNQLLRIDVGRSPVIGSIDTIAVGGSSQANTYETFPRDR